MPSHIQAAEIKKYADYEGEITVRHLRIGCILVMVLMPLGSLLDRIVYPDEVNLFLWFRLLCVALEGGILWLLTSHKVQRFHSPLGLLIALLPVLFICMMIGYTDGSSSPYYAGLNLVLLAIAFVLRWTPGLSLVAVLATLVLYLVSCLAVSPGGGSNRLFANNIYFLLLTGIIVVTGSRLHRQLRQREVLLRLELEESREQLEASNQKLVELNHVKNRFFANISHELRTPLTLLLAPLETMLQRHRNVFDEETRELLRTMQANGMRLLKLINDLLELVRLESGKLNVKADPIALDEWLRGLASAARQVAVNKGISLETKTSPEVGTILTDADKLEKILLNLIFNALKFTPHGGSVLATADQIADKLVIKVTDSGVGISADNLPHIFDRFYQADSSSRRKFQGAGIGLALVKELAEAQQGSVAVESTEGIGTTFTIQLPFVKAPAGTAAGPRPEADTALEPSLQSEQWLANLYRRAELFPALLSQPTPTALPSSVANGHRPRMLVAEDEPDMRRFLTSQLIRDYDIIEAADGQQAVDKAFEESPDIILLDMMMPEKDGVQACREIREHAPTRNVPIILLTARADEETKLIALTAGASDFLAKPFSTAELHVRIKNLVATGEFQRKLARQNVRLESAIEQLKETETQLVQTEKLASLGRLSAGIIHEINNPLNFTTMGIFTLKEKARLLPHDQQQEYFEVLRDIEEGISRVKNIVLDLRTFTHPDVRQIDAVNLSEAIDASLRFCSNEWKDRVTVDVRIPKDQVIVANKNKLIQVIVNLLQNSFDALKEKSFGSTKPTVWISGAVTADKSVLKIGDNGPGISPENIDKIFDPFFTTKDIGKGMGLGLSISYRLVQEYNGKITVRSESGEFCEFTLEFPTKPHA